MLVFFAKSQLSLFDTPVHVGAHVRKDGTVVKPHIRIQKVAVKQHSLFGDHHAAEPAPAKRKTKLDGFIAKHGGTAALATTIRGFTPQQQNALLEQMAKLDGTDVEKLRGMLGLDKPQAAAEPVAAPTPKPVEPAPSQEPEPEKAAAPAPKANGADFGEMFHGTARPFAAFDLDRAGKNGGGYDHQGRAVYLTDDKSGLARFFAATAATKVAFRDYYRGKITEAESDALDDSGGVILNVSIKPDAKILDLRKPGADAEVLSLFARPVGNKEVTQKLRERVTSLGYDGIAFEEPNRPEGWPTKHDAVTVVAYNPEAVQINGHGPAAEEGPKEGERNAEGLVFRDGRWHREDEDQPASTVPPSLDLPVIDHDGDKWHVLNTGASREDGKVFAHLSSTTRGTQTKNGINPAQINDWIDPPAAAEQPSAPAHEIIEHVTGKGKTLRGIVRTDIDGHAAAAIDPYTFRKNGGWFIREKHLGEAGAAAPAGTTAGQAPAPAPDPEAQARAAAEAAVAKTKENARKLREGGEKLLAESEAEYGRDRLANTARRARMAASSEANAAEQIRIAKTMINLASAIEDGDARHLMNVSTKAAVQTLESEVKRAIYETDKSLTYIEQQRQKGRDATDEDIDNAKFPAPKWGTAGTSLSEVLDAIKGKKGSKALAEKLRYSVGPTPETLVELRKFVDAEKIKSLMGWWNLERLAEMNRMQRIGINDTAGLREALREFLQYRGGHKAVDPIKQAERELVGKKVGVDFFPTPKVLSASMAEAAGIKPGMRVLEPSAGNGHLADAARDAGGTVDTVEISDTLRNILKAKGHNIASYDFETFEPAVKYDAVLMNPPFSDRKDAAHIMRAWDMLKPGGKMVAIAGEGVFFGSDKKAQEFRAWLDANGAEVEQLPAGTFMGADLPSQTGANARMIKITKPAEAAAAPVETAAAPAQDDGPKDGDRNADGLVFRNGRWHREGEQQSQAEETAQPVEQATAEASPAAEKAQQETAAPSEADLAEDREDLATELTRNPHSDKAKKMLIAAAERHAKGNAPKADSDDADDPNSASYRYADTGYIAGSRKEEAAANVIQRAKRDGAQVLVQNIDWEGLEQNPREAKELITKNNLFGVVPWDKLREGGMEPGAGFLIDRIYASIAQEPSEDKAQARKDYTIGLQTLRTRLESCKTADEVIKTLDELREEYDGKVLNAQEADAYKRASDALKPLYQRLTDLDNENKAARSKYYALRGEEFSKLVDERDKRERRGWKVDPKTLARIAELQPEIEAAEKKYHGIAERVQADEKAVRQQIREINLLVQNINNMAYARNKLENPLHRAWNIMGERFVGVLRFRSWRGASEAFQKHATAAKNGMVKDWDWLDAGGKTKAPKVKKESARFQMKVADRYERVGGRAADVDSTMALKSKFGLRDVQSGNWVLRDQVSAKFHVENTAAALSDLADLIGIPDEQVSFNNRLALAFGARGKGNTGFGGAAAAHYEPVHRVINMTKLNGGGSLAHEWFHAVDNMVKEAEGLGQSGTDDWITETPSLLPAGPLRSAFEQLRNAMMSGEHQVTHTHTYSAHDYRVAQHNLARNQYVGSMATKIKAAGNLEKALSELASYYDGPRMDSKRLIKQRKDWEKIAIAWYGGNPDGGEVSAKSGPKMSAFMLGANELDGGSKRAYYTQPKEMAARAFQSWVEDRLAGMGRKNDYLSCYADNKYHVDPLFGIEWKPFPEGAERENINKAFDNLMAVIGEQKVLAKALALW